ncbi:MAG: FAD-binding oxidoreductase [Phycisphaerae bacterium]|nr:FAD-binding oxidoreductase [Phycisphaerae bacterium]
MSQSQQTSSMPAGGTGERSARGRQVLVVGVGVSGLTCGVVLAEAGFQVRIVAQEHWRHCASGKAGGLWLPYRIEPRDRVLRWSVESFRTLVRLAEDPATGVLMRPQVELYRQEPSAEQVWWLSAVPGHRRLAEAELPPGYRCGFVAEVPVMDVPFYMPYLEQRLRKAGGTIEITGRPVKSLDALLEECSLVVNCTGLGARELCGDRQLYPIRGQLLRTTNPGIDRCVADELNPLGIAYVIARSRDCVLGGTAEENNENLTTDPDSRERLLAVNRTLEPRLDQAISLEDVVCLRPGRSCVRLEVEQRRAGRVVHNYGHGGAGFTVSWGCAREVAVLCQAAESGSR